MGSNSYQASPCRAEVGWAWWLLCHPSPNVRSATHQLFCESSVVSNRREPHMCVAEFTSHVACRPSTTRKQIAHSSRGRPANSGQQARQSHRGYPVIVVQPDIEAMLRQVWRVLRHRPVLLCVASPKRSTPCAPTSRRLGASADRRADPSAGGGCGASPPRKSARLPASAPRKRRRSTRAARRHLVPAVRVQPVIAQAYAEPDGHPVEQDRCCQNRSN